MGRCNWHPHRHYRILRIPRQEAKEKEGLPSFRFRGRDRRRLGPPSARGPPLCHAPCVRARLSHPTVSRVPRTNLAVGAPIRWYPYYRASVLPCQRRRRKGALCGIFRPARTPYRTLRFRIRLPIPCWRIGASGLWPQSRRPPHSRRRLRGGVSYVSAQRHHISEAPFRQEAKESRRLRRDPSRCNKPSPPMAPQRRLFPREDRPGGAVFPPWSSYPHPARLSTGAPARTSHAAQSTQSENPPSPSSQERGPIT